MTSGSFDFAPLWAPSLPPPAAKWTGFPKYNFTGGNNDADHVPVDRLIAAATGWSDWRAWLRWLRMSAWSSHGWPLP